MLFSPKEITLKNGRSALLRSPATEDAAAMLQYLKTTATETEFVLRYPEECTMTLAQEEGFLRNMLHAPDSVMILCEINGEIAGNCNLSRHNKFKNRHRASVAIALVEKYWNLGIGTAMFREMFSIAQSWGVEQLELEVIEGNERAIALYNKMGFQIVAEMPNAIRLKNGTRLKEYSMVKELKQNSAD